MGRSGTDYFVFSRSDAEGIPELSWMFDYFNVGLSLYTPSYPEGEVKFVEQVVPASYTTPTTRNGYYIEIEYCNDIYTGTEGNLKYQYTYCWSTYEYVSYQYYGNIGDGNIPDLSETGNGGGGGNSSSLSSYPLSRSIIQTNINLSSDDLKRLEDALKDLRVSCSGEAIYNYLRNNGNKFTEIKIDPGLGGEAGYTLGKGTLSFRESESIDAGALFHEMFHLFQESQGSYKGDQYIGLMEFERSLFDDIAFTVENAINGDVPYIAYEKKKSPFVDNGIPTKEGAKYRLWLSMITLEGEKYPSSINNNDLKIWMEYFNSYSSAYGGKCASSLNYEYNTLSKALELVKNNCNK